MKIQQILQFPINSKAALAHLEALKFEAIQEEQEKRRLEIINVFLKALPNRFSAKQWEDFHLNYSGQEHCKKIAMNFVATFAERLEKGTCLKFLGAAGTGKTLLSLLMYQFIAKAGFSVKYEASLQFLRLFQEKEFESYSAYQNLLDSYRRIQFLIIDEVSVGVGKGGYPAEWQRNHLYTLINQRYLNKLPTVIISNHNQDELLERLGEATVGRLSENGLTLAFNWRSYR